MHISKITIARLYNTGNYEHVRYELTAEVHADDCAKMAFAAISSILDSLKPDRSRPEKSELEHDSMRIVRMRTMTDDEWQREYAHAVGTRDEIIARYEVSLAEKRKQRAESIAKEQAAFTQLETFGGTVKEGGGHDHFQDND